MDYHHRPRGSMAARCFWWEIKSKFPKNRQLDPHPDRYRDHTHHITPPRSVVILSKFNNKTGSVAVDGVIILLNRNAICHPVNQLGGKSLEFSISQLNSRLF